ncbi:MAG: flavodoxin [Firmicutes bacterium]|nr:flavodoxin [Bacillota bacterium]
MSGIVLYKSKYGATKQYAGWIAGETGFDCMEIDKAKMEDIKQYDTIIFGGGVYASGISGLSFLKKNISQFEGKKVVVFCVGASPYDEKAFDELVARNMKDSLADLPCFYCRGAFDMDAMTFVDRNLCRMLQKSIAKKNPEEWEVWEKALMEAGNGKCDWTDKSFIDQILDIL